MRFGLLLLVFGCGRLGFDPSDLSGADGGGGGGGGGGDARNDSVTGSPDGVGAISSGCVPPGLGSTFDVNNAASCTPWGNPQNLNSTVSISGGDLVIELVPGSSALGACTGDLLPFAPGAGVVVQVDQLGTGSVGTTFYAASANGDLEIGVNSGVMRFFDPTEIASIPFDAATMSWWRIRPNDSTTASLFETAADGRTWVVQATGSLHDTMVSPKLGAGGANVAADTFVSFASVDVCPP